MPIVYSLCWQGFYKTAFIFYSLFWNANPKNKMPAKLYVTCCHVKGNYGELNYTMQGLKK